MPYSISREILDSHPPVFKHRIGDEVVFVKKREGRKNRLGKTLQFAIQYTLYSCTKNILMTPPAWGEAERMATEVGMLRRLAAGGFNVPKVLHVDPDYFVMSYAGETLEHLFKRKPDEQGRHIPLAVRELRRLHDAGFAHGGAQIKNIAVKEGKIHFLDLEESLPQHRMEAFKLRDVFLFLLSLEQHGFDPDLDGICALYDAAGPTGAREGLAKALRQIRAVRFMDHTLFAWMRIRDIRSLNRLIAKAEGTGEKRVDFT